MAALILASIPIVAAAYFSTMDPSVTLSRTAEEEKKKKGDHWVTDNVQLYLQEGISAPKVRPNDFYEISYVNPRGPIDKEMAAASNPQQAIYILGKHELERDKLTSSLYTEFIRRRTDFTIRSVDQPITQTHVLGSGSEADKITKFGPKFTEAPFPKQFGIDRWYPRYWTGPFYER